MTPLDLAIKQYIREFVEMQMNIAKHQTIPLSALPAIIIREVDKERFIDELWVYLNKKQIESNDQESN